jgi:hypothetical protein
MALLKMLTPITQVINRINPINYNSSGIGTVLLVDLKTGMGDDHFLSESDKEDFNSFNISGK